jgi:hypothetical protein
MPNWCMNNVTISHEDPEMMKKFEQGVKEGTLFETLLPLPTKNNEWDYGTAIEYWGTKWDVSNGDFSLDENGKSGCGGFDTAWGPPTEAYEKLKELGFDIDATYLETGMCFAGRWTNDTGDDSYEYDFEDEDWRDGIDDDEVLDMLESEYESWKEWQDEMADDEDEEQTAEEKKE